MRHHPLRPAPKYGRKLAVRLVPVRNIFVPILHQLVRAAAVNQTRHAAHQLDEVTESPRRGRPQLHVVDIAIQRLTESVHKFCHANLPPASLSRPLPATKRPAPLTSPPSGAAASELREHSDWSARRLDYCGTAD